MKCNNCDENGICSLFTEESLIGGTNDNGKCLLTNAKKPELSCTDYETKVYITFGQIHVHSVNSKTFDKDCIAVIKCKSYVNGRDLAFEYFKGIFYNCISQEEFDDDDKLILFFPRGLIGVN